MCNKQVEAILTGEIFATETSDFCGESWGRGRVFDVKVKVKVNFDWEKNQNSKPQKKNKKKTSYFNLRKIILTNPFFFDDSFPSGSFQKQDLLSIATYAQYLKIYNCQIAGKKKRKKIK